MKRRIAQYVVVLLLLFAFSLLSGCKQGTSTTENNTDGPQFLKGILLEIEYGDSILLDEYIDYVSDEYTIIAEDEQGIKEDLTDYPSWMPSHPGKYTITYTILDGNNKGSNSFELTVIPKRIMVELNYRNPYFVKGDSIEFDSYFEKMNINVDSFYDYEVRMEYIEHNGEKIDIEKGSSSYQFDDYGEYILHFLVETIDGQIKRYKEKIIVYNWNSEFYSWMKENHISGYNISETTAERSVVLNSGSHDGKPSDFPFGGLTHDISYIAYEGNYGLNDFVVVDFTGDNMPIFEFFKDSISNTYFWAQYGSNSDNKGMVLVNGYRFLDGSNCLKYAGTRNTRLELIGAYGIENQQLDNNSDGIRQCLNDIVCEEIGIENLQKDYADTKFRMIIGFTKGDSRSVTVSYVLVDLDNDRVLINDSHISTIPSSNSFEIPENYYTGSICLFGAHGRTISIDKVYPIEEDTTIDKVLEKYHPLSKFRDDCRTTIITGETLRALDYIVPVDNVEYTLVCTGSDGVSFSIESDTFVLDKSGSFVLTYNDGKNSINTLEIASIPKWMYDKNISQRKVTEIDDSTGSIILEIGKSEKEPYQGGGISDYSYIAFNGKYGLNDFVIFDFTGDNMPHVSFFNKTIKNGIWNLGRVENDNTQQVVVTNGFFSNDGSRIGGWESAYNSMIIVWGPYGAGDIGNTAFRRLGSDINAISGPSTQVLGSYNLNENRHYRVIMGITDADSTSMTLRIYAIDGSTGDVLVDGTYKIEFDFGEEYDFEGSIQLFGQNGRSIKLDSIFAIEEDTTIQDVVSKYSEVSKFKDNAPSIVNTNTPINVSDYIDVSNDYYLSYVFNDGVETLVTTDSLLFADEGKLILKYKDGIKIIASLEITVSNYYQWFLDNQIVTYNTSNFDEENHSIILNSGTCSSTNITQVPDMNCDNDLAYIGYKGNYSFNDYVVVDFTGDNMPVISFFQGRLSNSICRTSGWTDKENKRILIMNGLRINDGTIYNDWNQGSSNFIRGYGCYGFIHPNSGLTNGVCHFNTINDYGISKMQSMPNTRFRFIVGITEGTSNSITLSMCLIDLDTGNVLAEQENIVREIDLDGKISAEEFFVGNIEIMGTYGKSIVLDKIYSIEENTTFSAVKTKYAVN